MPNVTKKDLAKGIDAYSAKSSIPEGYSEDLVNVDTDASGKLKTRKGYQGYYGWLPLRATQVQHSGTDIRIQFNSAQTIDLSTTDLGPVVVQGRVSATGAAGDFTSSADASVWYDTFTISNRDTLSSPSGTLTKDADTTGLTTDKVFVGLAESTAARSNDNRALMPEDVQIDTSDYQIDLDYDVNTDTDAFVYFLARPEVAGTTYHHTLATDSATFTAASGTDALTSNSHGLSDADLVEFTTTDTLPGGLGLGTLYYVRDATTNTFKVSETEGGAAVDITDSGTGTHTWNRRSYSIDSSTHGLSNFNIITRVYDTALVGGKATEITPRDVHVTTTGTVRLELDDDVTGHAILTAAPLTNIKTTTLATTTSGPTSYDITISSPGGSFLFFDAFKYNAAQSRYEGVMVEDWVYDAGADEVTVTYVASGTAGDAVEIYWQTGDPLANAITVTDASGTSETYTDDDPQITVWGIDHDGIYSDSTDRGGHVNHIDTYRTVGEARVIAGLGGNLFKASTYSEGSSSYSMGTGTVNLRERVNGDSNLAPLFHTTDPGSVRDRGVVYDADVDSDGYAKVTAATFVSDGVVDYTLTFSSKSATLTLGSQVSTTDELSVKGMANPVHTGSHRILTVTDNGSTEAVIRVANAAVKNAVTDETGARGRAGVFTDTFELEAASNFIPGDTLQSSAITTLTPQVISASDTTIYLDGITSSLELPDGVLVFAQRTTDLVPLKDANLNAAVSGFVRGDMLNVTDLDRQVRVLGVQTNDNQTITFSGATGTAASAHDLNPGDKVLITNASATGVAGEYTVSSVPTTKKIILETSLSGSATLEGKLIQLDESLTVADSTSPTTFTVQGRWTPIEAPDTSEGLPKSTYVSHWTSNDYAEQPVLRSVTVNDSMFLTNGDDEVMKFDGTNLYRAGLPRWHPSFMAQIDTTATSTLTVGASIAYSSKDDDAKYFVVEASPLQVGDTIYETTADQTFTVVAQDQRDTGSNTEVRIYVSDEDDISEAAASGTLVKTRRYKYYARLNAVDVNNNVINSAIIGAEDSVIDYVQSGQIRLRMIGMPAFDAYDYDRIEIEIYRTAANGQLFYLQSRRLAEFDQGNGYIDVQDGVEDEVIAIPNNTDPVATSVRGAELGPGWDQPPRAKYITTVNNRLLLANLKGYPEADIVFKPAIDDTIITTGDVAGKRILFRRDSTDTATGTDVTNRVAFDFEGDGEYTISPSGDISSDSATFTVTHNAASGLSAGDWVYMFHSAEGTTNSLTFAGWWQAASTTSNTFTVKFTGGETPDNNDVDRFIYAPNPADVPVWLGPDGNFNQRDGNTDGTLENLIPNRLAKAIHASQRVNDTAGFTPWLQAEAGNDWPSGQLRVHSPKVMANTPEVVMPDALNLQIFVHGLGRSADEEVGFLTRILPSRLVRSYQNFPELFDNTLIPDPSGSDSAIDINPADGQEITGIIPFFGTSAVNAESQLAQQVVVFKENSIYLVNIETRAVEKIDSRGLGCTAPKSITSTYNGIMFANESGIFLLDRQMEVRYIGRMMNGFWRDEVNLDQLAEATGHNYSVGRKYKLSVPTGSDLYNSEVYVYDHDRESATGGPGAWTRYTNHPVVGWCNLEENAFFASTQGDVFIIRNLGEASDYRDEAAAVAEQDIKLRPEDFGVPGLRKVIANVVTSVELDETDLTQLSVDIAKNVSTDYTSMDTVSLDTDNYRQLTFRSVPQDRRGTHVQIRYRHSTKDEALVITGIAYNVNRSTYKLITEGADT